MIAPPDPVNFAGAPTSRERSIISRLTSEISMMPLRRSKFSFMRSPRRVLSPARSASRPSAAISAMRPRLVMTSSSPRSQRNLSEFSTRPETFSGPVR
jgi:hypothetical protein